MAKTKKDKDKAIRLIIQLIGKDRVSAFLNQHAGSADILDKLLDAFGAAPTINNGTSPSKNPPGPPKVALIPAKGTTGGNEK